MSMGTAATCLQVPGARSAPADGTTRDMMLLVKSLVSKKKRRLVEDGFNLDLSYITARIIAMGYPADRLEALYRNDAHEVAAFLEERHGQDFFVYNLCRERQYDACRFSGRVLWVPMRDHNPPPLPAIRPFCESAHEWLAAKQSHVVVVHCKAGKGRTGVMTCCFLLHAGVVSTPQQAVEVFARRRTSDGKGITIPSQLRYVDYYHRLLAAERAGRPYRAVPLRLTAAELCRVDGWPAVLEATVATHGSDAEERLLYTSQPTCHVDGQKARLTLDAGVVVCGDVSLVIWGRRLARLPRERLCQLWFNTWFVADLPRDACGRGTVTWSKRTLDVACRDERIPDSASVQLFFLGEEAAVWAAAGSRGPREPEDGARRGR